jgi:acetyl esterase
VTAHSLDGDMAPDCEALRRDLIERQLPPVWSLDAETARRLHREGSDAVRSAWVPPLASLPVVSEDVDIDGLPSMRRYSRTDGDDVGVTVVWLHGGGWVLGDLETGHGAAITACALTGWEVVSVDYRCAPVDRFPAALDDSLAAASWLLDMGRRVVVAGDSAGGNLAAVVARRHSGHPGLIGQVLVYPATDPTLSYPSAREFVEGPFLTRRDMEWFYDQYLPAGLDRTDPRVDLMGGDDLRSGGPGSRAVPAVVFTAGHDPLRDEGVAYARLLADNGADVTWIHAPELFHGCLTQSGVLPSSAVRVSEVWAAAHRMFT